MRNKLKIPAVIKDNFRFSTLSFIFIIAYVNIFQMIFGTENSIVGVIFTIMMSASMVRDLTATPVRHLFFQAFVLVWMAVAACLVTVLPVPFSFAINFITLLVILYAFTYEYSSHMYFPYILSYLFLVFISPAGIHDLPKRIAGMLVGAVSIILYQLVMGRKRVVETARDVLNEMIDDIRLMISCRLSGKDARPDSSAMRSKLCQLSQSVYDRRKKVLCISDASFSMIDAGRGLENLFLLIGELPETLSNTDRALLTNILRQLDSFRDYLHQDISELPDITYADLSEIDNSKTTQLFYKNLTYIRDRLIHMSDPQRKVHYRKTALSLKVQLQAALDVSPVRAVYALRVALLLSCATVLVQLLNLPHGRWLLFTLASVSLPYADDVPVKMKKRILATIIGGLLSVVIYSLIPSPAGRTAAMMLSGYISFYFSDYTETFACSTIGALGGAVFMQSFGFQAVGGVFITRIGYILAGAVIAYLVNCLLFPFSRAKATRQLWAKYSAVTELLTTVARSLQVDTQLYYSLVIQAHLLEKKLTDNAALEDWEECPERLAQCREKVRKAHRKHIVGRENAPVFDAEHLCKQ